MSLIFSCHSTFSTHTQNLEHFFFYRSRFIWSSSAKCRSIDNYVTHGIFTFSNLQNYSIFSASRPFTIDDYVFFSLLPFYEPTKFFPLTRCLYFFSRSFILFCAIHLYDVDRWLCANPCDVLVLVPYAVCLLVCARLCVCVCIWFYPTVTFCSEYSHWMTVHSNNVCMSSQ